MVKWRVFYTSRASAPFSLLSQRTPRRTVLHGSGAHHGCILARRPESSGGVQTRRRPEIAQSVHNLLLCILRFGSTLYVLVAFNIRSAASHATNRAVWTTAGYRRHPVDGSLHGSLMPSPPVLSPASGTRCQNPWSKTRCRTPADRHPWCAYSWALRTQPKQRHQARGRDP